MISRKNKTILFDLDETLVDQSSAEKHALEKLHPSIGKEYESIDDLLLLWRQARSAHLPAFLAGKVSYEEYHRQRLRFVCGSGLTDMECDRCYAKFIQEYRSAWRLFDDVIPCLDILSEYTLSVLTNGHGPFQREKLIRTEIMRRFAHVFVSDEIGAAKPDATAYLRATQLMSEAPEDIIYIGNETDVDMRGARDAGISVVRLDRTHASDSNEFPCVGDLRTLPELLSRELELAQQTDPVDFTWITENLAVGSARQTKERSFAARYGFDLIVDLREEVCSDLSYHGRCRRVHIPTPDYQSISQQDLQSLIAIIRGAMREHKRVLIHCEYGIGRSVQAGACVLISGGMDPRTALALIKTKRAVASPSPTQLHGMLEFSRQINNSDATSVCWNDLATIAYSDAPQ